MLPSSLPDPRLEKGNTSSIGFPLLVLVESVSLFQILSLFRRPGIRVSEQLQILLDPVSQIEGVFLVEAGNGSPIDFGKIRDPPGQVGIVGLESRNQILGPDDFGAGNEMESCGLGPPAEPVTAGELVFLLEDPGREPGKQGVFYPKSFPCL